MLGLEETIEVVKTPWRTTCIRADGRKQSCGVTKREDRSGWLERHGALDPDLVDVLGRASEDTIFDAVVHFVAPNHRGDVDAQQRSIRDARARVLPAVRATGAVLRIEEPSDYSPTLAIRASGKAIRAIARISGVDNVLEDGPVRLEESMPLDHGALYTEAPAVAWPQHVRGEGRLVGVLDPGPCKILDTHEVFTEGVKYRVPEFTQKCATNADCLNACGSAVDMCVGGYCVDGHGHWVSSAVSLVAPAAKVYYANGFVGDYDSTTFRTAYEYFRANEVSIVNQSFRVFGSQYSYAQGIHEDEFARRYGMLTVKSAGNGGGLAPGPDADKQSACPYHVNALCVGAHNQAERHSCFSKWANPGYEHGSPDDREEPDILAYGGDHMPSAYQDYPFCPAYDGREGIRLASRTSISAYESNHGTSFAAPTAAGAAALLQQFCASQGTNLNDLGLRSVLMISALSNAEGGRYSTLKPGEDWRDGAGVLKLQYGFGLCKPGPEGPAGSIEPNPGQLDKGERLPEADHESPYPHDPPTATRVLPRDQDSHLGFDNTKWGRRIPLGYLEEGTRVRAVLSWNGCAGHNRAPGTVGTDYDLMLWHEADGAYPYFTSQSNDDNNEGLDVVIANGHRGATLCG